MCKVFRGLTVISEGCRLFFQGLCIHGVCVCVVCVRVCCVCVCVCVCVGGGGLEGWGHALSAPNGAQGKRLWKL